MGTLRERIASGERYAKITAPMAMHGHTCRTTMRDRINIHLLSFAECDRTLTQPQIFASDFIYFRLRSAQPSAFDLLSVTFWIVIQNQFIKTFDLRIGANFARY